ncbi:MAG: hypothetical protein LBI33_04330 [Propionibacteriaceae bacterium]|jgi:hypothetical protein|nr:hypothetical protein [Propionibacteriaceae bacterium]
MQYHLAVPVWAPGFPTTIETGPAGFDLTTADKRAALASWLWFLDHAREGLPLTAAGYLKPVDVEALAAQLPAADHWIGKHNREDLTPPVADFRQALHDLSLIRKSKGRLLLTPAGRQCRGNPAALWDHLATRVLPAPGTFEREVITLELTLLLAGHQPDIRLVAAQLNALGWTVGDREAIIDQDLWYLEDPARPLFDNFPPAEADRYARAFARDALAREGRLAEGPAPTAAEFDDPAIQAAMAEMGVVHRPGSAAQQLAEMAPYLAEEGIDLDNLGPDTDFDALNAALDRATERYNLELRSPRGRDLSEPFLPGMPSELPLPRERDRTPAGRAKTGKGVSGNPAKRGQQRTDQAAVNAFTAWLHAQEVISGPNVETEADLYAWLIAQARGSGIDPSTPAGLDLVVDVISQLADEETDAAGPTQACLLTLDDYIHFRIAKDGPAAWEALHERVEQSLSDANPLASALSTAIMVADRIDPDVRRTALAEIPLVSAVARLLGWIGKGRPITTAGNLRRADIAEAAAMLGIDAIGVDRAPDWTVRSTPGPLQVTSMSDISRLSSWWRALCAAKLLKLTTTKVRPGPEADTWLAEPLLPADLAEQVVAFFVGDTVINTGGWYYEWGVVVARTIARLAEAVDPGNAPLPTNLPAEVDAERVDRQVIALVRALESAGLLRLDGDRIVVRPELRGALAQGAVVALAMLEETG